MTSRMNHCGECGAAEGQFHVLGCDTERCPFCGDQLITCYCCYQLLGLRCELGTRVYEEGLTDLQERRWIILLEKKGRIPHIRWPYLCSLCGALYPEMFGVPEEKWKHYIEPAHQQDVICRPCYDKIRRLIDSGARARVQQPEEALAP